MSIYNHTDVNSTDCTDCGAHVHIHAHNPSQPWSTQIMSSGNPSSLTVSSLRETTNLQAQKWLKYMLRQTALKKAWKFFVGTRSKNMFALSQGSEWEVGCNYPSNLVSSLSLSTLCLPVRQKRAFVEKIWSGVHELESDKHTHIDETEIVYPLALRLCFGSQDHHPLNF